MMVLCVARAAVLLGLLVLPLLSARAQSPSMPPAREVYDERGVNLVTGLYQRSASFAHIGAPSVGGLSVDHLLEQTTLYSGGFYKPGVRNWLFSFNSAGVRAYRVQLGTTTVTFSSSSFTDTGADFTLFDDGGKGAKLQRTSGVYTYTASNGLTATFSSTLVASTPSGGVLPPPTGSDPATAIAIPTSITATDGSQTTFHYKLDVAQQTPQKKTYYSRISAVSTNDGWLLKYKYETNSSGGLTSWNRVVEGKLVNAAVEYCDPNADACDQVSSSWPKVTYQYPGGETWITDNAGKTWKYYFESTGCCDPEWPDMAMKFLSPAGRLVTVVTDGTTWRVKSWSDGAVTYEYTYYDADEVVTTIVTGPLGYRKEYQAYKFKGLIYKTLDELYNVTTYEYDAQNRLVRIVYPEGNYTKYTYDARGNVTESRRIAKSGSGLADIVETASYDSTCSNPVTCNKPNYTIDARGNRTDYTYDPIHGGVLTVTAPAPATGGVRPQTRYTYEAKYAWLKSSSSGFVQAATPIYRLVSISACSTGASCAAAATEVKTTFTFQVGSSSAGSNILPLTVSTGSGDGALVATTASAYDNLGNVISIDGPLPSTDDTVYLRYDAARQLVGTVGPDPDWTGALKRRAVRISYNFDGQVSLSERGTVDGLTDPNWAAFASLEQTATAYDSAGRAIKSWLAVGSTTYAMLQTSYDAAGRPECVAQRMNPAVFASLPASACTLGTSGANGPDRIAKTVYNSASQVLQQITALGTGVQATDTTSTYTANGLLATLADANGNVTTYSYDGFDRLKKVRYPNTSGGGSSTTDYEEYTYDAGGNTLTFRRRDGQVITYTYDNLSRIATQDAPATTWTYDNLGRVTSIADGTNTLTWTFDALGRPVAKTDAFGTWGYQYDLAGNRTRITYPDSYYATYSYDVTGAVTAIGEAGGALATYYYDNLGRRVGIARANGTYTTYGFDPVSRLTALTQDLSGTSDDITKGFTYSPASQILNQSVDNTAYIWTTSTLAGTFTLNGLNQAISFNSTSITYDGRGNLTSDGTATYSYDIANRLTAKTGGLTLTYDPAGRLLQVAGASTTQFAYDEGRIIAEYDGTGAMLRRYIPGTGVDETVVWYEGSAFTQRRFLHADERGSVISVTDNAGAALATNTYDEYGMPGSSNLGRFQYTGQAYIAELGLYYYKARLYDPRLRRFLQPDPIGYGDGMAIYAYVAGDPINSRDTSGLAIQEGSEEVTVIGRRLIKEYMVNPFESWGCVDTGFSEACDLARLKEFGCPVILLDGSSPPDNKSYTAPPGVDNAYLIRAMNRLAELNGDENSAYKRARNFSTFYETSYANSPHYLDFKRWGQKNGPAGSSGPPGMFDAFGNYFYGLSGTLGGVDWPILEWGAGNSQAGNTWYEKAFGFLMDDALDAPHVWKGIFDGIKYGTGNWQGPVMSVDPNCTGR